MLSAKKFLVISSFVIALNKLEKLHLNEKVIFKGFIFKGFIDEVYFRI